MPAFLKQLSGSRKSHTNKDIRRGKQLGIESLERREMMTNHVLLDFTPDFVAGETVQANNFASAFNLTGSNGLVYKSLNPDNDGWITNNDVQIMADQITNRAAAFYAGYDVKFWSADVFQQTNRGLSWMQWEYEHPGDRVFVMYVGGWNFDGSDHSGVAHLPPEGTNFSGHYGFTFFSTIASSYGEHASWQTVAQFTARTVAHEVGHLMGLDHLDGHPAINHVMSYKSNIYDAYFPNWFYPVEGGGWQNAHQEIVDSLSWQPRATHSGLRYTQFGGFQGANAHDDAGQTLYAFDAAMKNGVLTVTGSESADKIVVRQAEGMISIDGLNGQYRASAVKEIKVDGHGGDDTILVLGETVGRLQAITAPCILIGGAGNDTLQGARGNDCLSGGSGNDRLSGGAGIDTLVEAGNVHMVLTNATLTGLGRDSLSQIEKAQLTGGTGDNTINASSFHGSTVLLGLAGNDLLIGGRGNDVLSGGNGNDTLRDSIGSSLQIGGRGSDTLSARSQGLLVACETKNEGDASALDALLTEWSRTDHTLQQRMTTLKPKIGAIDDGARDTLLFGDDSDWLWLSLSGANRDKAQAL